MTSVAEHAYRIGKHPRLALPAYTLRTMCALHCWRVAECNAAAAPTGAANNLLNTTRTLDGSTDYNTNAPPVQNYQTVEQGVWATVLTLTNGRYDNVLDLLRADAPAPDVLVAIGQTQWGTFRGWTPQRAADFCASVYRRFGIESLATVRDVL